MADIATITSKRQLTIPASVFKKAKLKERQRVLLEEDKGEIKIKTLVSLLGEMAGSVTPPKRFRGLGPEQILKQAKKEYFAKRG